MFVVPHDFFNIMTAKAAFCNFHRVSLRLPQVVLRPLCLCVRLGWSVFGSTGLEKKKIVPRGQQKCIMKPM